MAEVKRYFWLKLKDNFFDDKYVKALRRLPDGDGLVIIYLKMQLESLKTEGIINYEGILSDCIDELALTINEDADTVKAAVETFVKFGIVEQWDNGAFYMTAVQQSVGSESESAERVREHRKKKKLQCNADVTKCNTDIDIEKDIDTDIETDKDIKTETDTEITPHKSPRGDMERCSDSFDEFWNIYPKKVSKSNALKAWNKLKPDDDTVRSILSALEKQKMSSQWQKEDGQFIPYPATWLNGRRWEDDISYESSKPKEEYSYNIDDYKAFVNDFDTWNKRRSAR